MNKFKLGGFQSASDLQRDGLGVELLDSRQQVVAEVFRSDRDKTVEVSIFVDSLPLASVEQLIATAKKRLDPFEDGTPLREHRE